MFRFPPPYFPFPPSSISKLRVINTSYHVHVIVTLQYEGSAPIWAALQSEERWGHTGNGHPKIVVALVEAAADVNHCRLDGNTPLHVASQRGKAEMVSTLMTCNASLTMKNNEGQLPIDVAANDEIRQLINDEMTARFDHGLKRAVIPPPFVVDSAEAATAELEQNIRPENSAVGFPGTVSANATSTSVAEEDEDSEQSSDEEDDGA